MNSKDRLLKAMGILPDGAPSYDEVMSALFAFEDELLRLRQYVKHLEGQISNCVTLGSEWEHRGDLHHARLVWYALGMEDVSQLNSNL